MPKVKSGHKKSRSKNRTSNMKKKKKQKYRQKLAKNRGGSEEVDDVTFTATRQICDHTGKGPWFRASCRPKLGQHDDIIIKKTTQAAIPTSRKLESDIEDVCSKLQEILRQPNFTGLRKEADVEYPTVDQLARHVRDLIVGSSQIGKPERRSMPPLAKEQCLKLLKEMRISL